MFLLFPDSYVKFIGVSTNAPVNISAGHNLKHIYDFSHTEKFGWKNAYNDR